MTMRRCAPWATRLAALLLAGGLASAQAAGGAWSALTAEQRSALAPLEKDWADIDASRQQKWLEIAARFPRISDEERQRMQERMAEWARMSPRERDQARINFQEIRQLSPEDRQARWESYRALPEEQRRELAARARPPVAATKPRADGDKSNIVAGPTAAATVRPVAPTVVQVAPGATTTLVTRPPQPPLHQQAGLPKIAATPAFVDTATLLPKRGAQGAAVSGAVAAPRQATPRATPASSPASAVALAASAEAAPTPASAASAP